MKYMHLNYIPLAIIIKLSIKEYAYPNKNSIVVYKTECEELWI